MRIKGENHEVIHFKHPFLKLSLAIIVASGIDTIHAESDEDLIHQIKDVVLFRENDYADNYKKLKDILLNADGSLKEDASIIEQLKKEENLSLLTDARDEVKSMDESEISKLNTNHEPFIENMKALKNNSHLNESERNQIDQYLNMVEKAKTENDYVFLYDSYVNAGKVYDQIDQRIEPIIKQEQAAKKREDDLKAIQNNPNLRPSLGCVFQELPNSSGLIVWIVYNGYGASKAGLKEDDVITSVDGQFVGNMDDLKNIMMNHVVGDTVEVTTQNGTTYQVKLNTSVANLPSGNAGRDNETVSKKGKESTWSMSVNGSKAGTSNNMEIGFQIQNIWCQDPSCILQFIPNIEIGDYIIRVGSYYITDQTSLENAWSHYKKNKEVEVIWMDQYGTVHTSNVKKPM